MEFSQEWCHLAPVPCAYNQLLSLGPDSPGYSCTCIWWWVGPDRRVCMAQGGHCTVCAFFTRPRLYFILYCLIYYREERNFVTFPSVFLFHATWRYSVSVCMCHMSVVPSEARRGHQIHWNWSDEPLWAAWIWGLGFKFRSAGTAVIYSFLW